MFENHWNISERDRDVRNGSKELKSFGADFEKSSKGTRQNCCAQVMTEKKSGMLPVAYRRIYNGNPRL